VQAIDELVAEAERAGRPLSQSSVERFEIYLETLLFWRQRLSLTGASSALQIVRSHITDSLFVVPYLRKGLRIADLGSGAGFPGIPLAISCPDITVSLVEANRKKANFLREVARKGGLTNVMVIEERAESLSTVRSYVYDLIVSRAVWPVTELLRLSEPILASGGLAVAMKGPKGREEANSTHPSFSEPDVIGYRLRGDVRRILLLYRKEGEATVATR
jgi:16S rRNA (guanine527-N7)-methyltransferase